MKRVTVVKRVTVWHMTHGVASPDTQGSFYQSALHSSFYDTSNIPKEP